MIDTNINHDLLWSARRDGAGTVVVGKLTRQDGASNPAGLAFRFAATGQLVLRGYKVRFTAAAAGDGVAFVDRRTANGAVGADDDALFSVVASAAGRFDSGCEELFVPLRTGRIEGDNIFNAGQLEAVAVGGATAIEIVAWGVHCDTPTYKPCQADLTLGQA